MQLAKRFLIAAGTATLAGLGSTAAMAQIYPDFQVTETVVPGTIANVFTADKITGNYVEVITFGAGTFNVSLKWQAGQFVADNGTTPVGSQLGSLTPNQYQLYGLYQGAGTFSTVGTVTTFTTTAGVGSLNVWIDPLSNSTFTAPLTGASAWAVGNVLDDLKVASGTPGAGAGTLDTSLSTCGTSGPINCGSFGTSSSFALTPFGSTYFTSPVPFYSVSFQAGQLNNFSPSGTVTINGSMDVVFATVPEPSTVALAGLALLGLSVSLRRKRE